MKRLVALVPTAPLSTTMMSIKIPRLSALGASDFIEVTDFPSDAWQNLARFVPPIILAVAILRVESTYYIGIYYLADAWIVISFGRENATYCEGRVS